MFRILLLFSLSFPAFAITVDQCTLAYFNRAYTSLEIVIDKSRIGGEEAFITFRNLRSDIRPYFDILHILRAEDKNESIVLEKAMDHDKCGNAFENSTNLKTICVKGVNADVVCEKRCVYYSNMDPDCDY